MERVGGIVGDFMTESEEIIIYGNVMHKIDAQGNIVHIPREQWDVFYKPTESKMTTLSEYKAMMEGATDAPWVVERPTGNTTHIKRGGINICRVRKPLHCWEEMENNADFIAASRNIAPELIRVIELAEDAFETCGVNRHGQEYHDWDKVKNALSEIRKLKV